MNFMMLICREFEQFYLKLTWGLIYMYMEWLTVLLTLYCNDWDLHSIVTMPISLVMLLMAIMYLYFVSVFGL